MKYAENSSPADAAEAARRTRATTMRRWMSALCAGLLTAFGTTGVDWTSPDWTAWRGE